MLQLPKLKLLKSTKNLVKNCHVFFQATAHSQVARQCVIALTVQCYITMKSRFAAFSSFIIIFHFYFSFTSMLVFISNYFQI